MIEKIHLSDYDLRISDIITAHEFTLAPGEIMSSFVQRRGYSGIALAISGECAFRTQGASYVLREGEIAYLPADAAYTAEVPADGKPFRHYTVNFSLSDISGAEHIKGMLTAKEPYVTEFSAHADLRTFFPQLVNCWHDKNPGYRVHCRQLLYGMLYDLASRYIAQLVNPDLLARILPAKRLIDEHYNEDLSISSMAELCGLSETHFRRCFYIAYGMSPISYRTKLRIERAKDLLLGSWYSVGEIAEMTGFSDISFFSRFFTRHTGLSPSVYRREYGDRGIKEAE